MSSHASYYFFNEITFNPTSDYSPEQKYGEGYVFTRLGPHLMRQVRSVRVPISSFQLSSENRRILKNYTFLDIHYEALPYRNYHWTIGKIAADFYKAKSGMRAMSAQKIKSIFTSPHESMNGVFTYQWKEEVRPLGYCLLFASARMLHYAYPFYDIVRARALSLPSLGMAMMLQAILWAQEKNMDYVYLGSIRDERSLYKFQFKGVEWWDGIKWLKGGPKNIQFK